MGSNTIACRGQANGATAGTNGLTSSGLVVPFANTALCWTLPLKELLQFEGRLSGQAVTLSWELTEEINLEKIVLEKTVDQARYTSVAHFENINRVMQFADQVLPTAVTYYRLKIYRRNGTTGYSSFVVVQPVLNEPFSILKLHPNPVVNTLLLELFVPQPQTLKFHILNTTGRKISAHTFSIRAGYTTLNIPVRSLPPGLYIIKAEGKGKQTVSRFIKK
jgi:hypothetical protein